MFDFGFMSIAGKANLKMNQGNVGKQCHHLESFIKLLLR
jgi:hypothetical protein